MNVSQNLQMSNPKVVSPFGALPYSLANQYAQGFATPLSRGINAGFPGGMNAAGQQVGGAVSGIIPGATALGGRISTMAGGAYGDYQNSVDQFMSQLPGVTNLDTRSVQGAGDILSQAFSPTTTSSLFNESANQALGQARLTEAARGMVDTGASAAGEQQNILTPLANQYMQERLQNENQAVQTATGTAGGVLQNAMAPVGVTSNTLTSVLPSLFQSLVGGLNLPMTAAGGVLSTLMQGKSPLTNLLQMVAPQVAQKSFGGGGSIGMCDARVKTILKKPVPGISAARKLSPVTFTYTVEGLPKGEHFGFVAQQVHGVIPSAIGRQGDHFTIDYKEVIPVLLQAIKDLDAEVEQLQQRLDVLGTEAIKLEPDGEDR